MKKCTTIFKQEKFASHKDIIEFINKLGENGYEPFKIDINPSNDKIKFLSAEIWFKKEE
jgi:hypothetical protein